ncbi:MAG: very short patch repair endonuclease [Lentisphaeria bacterium]|nr:very short patch repair endonuclease [Lentisphaeria bacterium]
MVDSLTKEKRSWNMAQVKSKNTKPERLVRALLHAAGFRFTVNGPKNKQLPGKPDIVLPKYRTVVFVHGCFWHRHPGCKATRTPKSNQDFWEAKFARNVARDQRDVADLTAAGWAVVVVWECELKHPETLLAKLKTRLLKTPSSLTYEEPAERYLTAAESADD